MREGAVADVVPVARLHHRRQPAQHDARPTVARRSTWAARRSRIDAACSSALVAIHEAMVHLRARQCDVGARRRRVPEPHPDNLRRLLAHRRHLALGRVPPVRRARRRLRDGRGRRRGGAQAPRRRRARRRPHLRGHQGLGLQQRRARRGADDSAARGPDGGDGARPRQTSTCPSRASASSRRTAPRRRSGDVVEVGALKRVLRAARRRTVAAECYLVGQGQHRPHDVGGGRRRASSRRRSCCTTRRRSRRSQRTSSSTPSSSSSDSPFQRRARRRRDWRQAGAAPRGGVSFRLRRHQRPRAARGGARRRSRAPSARPDRVPGVAPTPELLARHLRRARRRWSSAAPGARRATRRTRRPRSASRRPASASSRDARRAPRPHRRRRARRRGGQGRPDGALRRGAARGARPPVAFLFPGQGAQRVGLLPRARTSAFPQFRARSRRARRARRSPAGGAPLLSLSGAAVRRCNLATRAT